MESKELEASLLLNAIPSLGPTRYQKLITHFKTAYSAVDSGIDAWVAIDGFGKKVLQKVKEDWGRYSKVVDNELEIINRLGIKILLWQQKNYPQSLREIFAAPPIIYVWGNQNFLEIPLVAVVGSRRCSYYGQRVAKELGAFFAEQGVATISGMARGIDSAVHRASIKGGGETFAVLGSGFQYIYPPENKPLSSEIRDSGALISEFPLNTTPFPPNFPRRNRIISALSQATIVVEGTEKSGSLITAKLAAEQGREVYAVPGPIHSPLSGASHLLIQNGAKLLGSVDELIEDFKLDRKKKYKEENKDLSSDSDPILRKIGFTPVPKDFLVTELKQSPGELSHLLLTLELQGRIKSLPGGFYVRKK